MPCYAKRKPTWRSRVWRLAKLAWYDVTWKPSLQTHRLCYKTDFLFVKSRGPQSYFRCTLLNTQWTICASIRWILKCVFFFSFICVFRKYMFCVQLYGKWAVEGALSSFLKHKTFITQKTHLIFSDFCRKCHATTPENNQVDPIGVLKLKVNIKSALSPCSPEFFY